ncbi:hypothetical protein GCM10023261_07920 [Bartonella jaculi]|uniref:Uncharacterized protein n=1 Tax=Bartonella jaculi TaxID=686226 RepID=A0ABP9N5Q0_9HYPH
MRELVATCAANAEATVLQLKALFGFTEDSMAQFYTKTTDRKRLVIESIKKVQNIQKNKIRETKNTKFLKSCTTY